MAGHFSKGQVLYSPKRPYRIPGYKKVFLALCFFALGIFIVGFASRSLDLNHSAPVLSTNLKSPGHVKEIPLYYVGKGSFAQGREFDVNHTTGNVGVPEHAVPKISEESVRTSKGLKKLSAHMRQQVEFLRDAIEEAHHQNLQLAVEPKCKGNISQGEVEDILCLPRPKFIKDVRNPCWWDLADNKTLRCIPYFHILGCEKCGSSDLWDRITSHPHAVRVIGIHNKEANWWGWARYGRFHYFKAKRTDFTTGYTKIFQPLTQKVQESLENGNDAHRHLVTGDGTPSDLSDFCGWVSIPQNRGLKLPQVLTPHLMKHIYPETTKFIVLLRDPIERLYSDFCFATGGLTAAQFHTNLLGAIDEMAKCVKKHSLLECFFDLKMYRTGVVRLHLILYTLYIREWLKVFPRERFLFFKTEEYARDTFGTVKKCFEFLNFEPLNDTSLRRIANQPHALPGMKKRRAGPMWRSTKDILEEIVKPSMHFLPELLEDDRFMWDFKSTPVVEH